MCDCTSGKLKIHHDVQLHANGPRENAYLGMAVHKMAALKKSRSSKKGPLE